jgi:beta-lactam-binding protein with PASTA domain
MLTVVLLSGVLVAAIGIGYTASRPLLGDAAAFLPSGYTVVHLNSETGKSDAELAMTLATGKEKVQLVRLPNGRLMVVNKDTGTVSYLNAATLNPDAPETKRPGSAGKIDPVATASDGYLFDRGRNTVEKITVPGQSPPVQIPDGIKAAVPCADSVWVLTHKGEIVEVVGGKAGRKVRLGAATAGITVADSHPVAVTEDGNAYVIDTEQPTAIGNIGLSGSSLELGAWQGAGRYVVAVDRDKGEVAVLDPRTSRRFTVRLKVKPEHRPDLRAPVMLGSWVYVPDYSGPSLWRVDVTKGSAADKPLDVPGNPGAFELTVTGGRVWANSQYDQRVLVVDAAGHEQRGDKGPRPELTDTTGKTGPPADHGQPTGPRQPTPPEGSAPEGPQTGPTGTAGPMVTVPSFPRGTPYSQACANISKLKLVCRSVAAGDDETGLRTGDVLGTDPAAGSQVPEGSRVVVRYVGPLRTPAVIGVAHEDACGRIRAARLTCAERVATDPASAPEQLGLVSAQDPAANASIAKGGKVTITYRDSIGLPNFVDQMQDAACDRLVKQYRMTCMRVAGDPPPAGKQPGQVYQQVPPAGTVAKIGTTVTIRYYRGQSTLGGVVGQNIFAGCGAVQAAGLECVPVEGTCAWGTGHPVGEVYDQKPPAGTVLNVGAKVQLTFYGGKCPLPSYGGWNEQAACADINARGFVCNPALVLHPSTNVVVAQNPPGGTAQLGSPVTIQYSKWTPVAKAPLYGKAYPVGTDIPGARLVYHYTCDAGGDRCRGLPTNSFYSTVTKDMTRPDGRPYIDTDFNGTGYAVLMTCGTAPGQRKVWRTWNAGSPRYYNVVLSETKPRWPPEGDSEELGCVW